MDTLQKFFNRLAGVHEPWYAQRGTPIAVPRTALPHGVELPACWRRRAKRVRGHSRREPL